MANALSLDALWRAAGSSGRAFTREQVADLPDMAQRYLLHAIQPGVALASAVRLRMHGEIKLKDWFPFTAEQVTSWQQGMIWNATVRMHGLPVSGFDRLIHHEGEMQWKILGLIPLMHATGADITRAAAGRILAETVWLPSALCREEVVWKEQDASHVCARVAVEGECAELTLGLDDAGRPRSVVLPRWGNPEGAAFHYAPFGGIADQEATFDGYTIPTHLRVGWHYGTPQFDTVGEFFRCTIDHVEFK